MDRTAYIRRIEEADDRVLFLRRRRFGESPGRATVSDPGQCIMSYPTTHQIPSPTPAPNTANTPIPKPIITFGLPNSRAPKGVSDFTTAASGHTSAQQ